MAITPTEKNHAPEALHKENAPICNTAAVMAQPQLTEAGAAAVGEQQPAAGSATFKASASSKSLATDFESLKLDPRLLAIMHEHGYTVPTAIQAATFPLAANGYDVIGVSQTGSGKTLAFVLPVISQILASNKPFHTLIIAPTREVAQQIADCIALFARLDIRCVLLLGGGPISEQAHALSTRPQIVVGVPGRIAKHAQKTKSFKLDQVRKLVLDEADRFFECDFLADLDLIAARLVKKTQALMFTATLTEKTEQLAKLFMRAPRVIGGSARYEQPGTLRERVVFVPEKYKLVLLSNLLASRPDAAIVFVAMCASAQRVAALLVRRGVSCAYLHGSMPQTEREATLARFREGAFTVLVSTNLASRGLDIPHVDLVINYDLPNTARDYTHRIGRTARATRTGTALSLATQYTVGKLQRLEHVLGRQLEEETLQMYDNAADVQQAYREVCEELTELPHGRRR